VFYYFEKADNIIMSFVDTKSRANLSLPLFTKASGHFVPVSKIIRFPGDIYRKFFTGTGAKENNNGLSFPSWIRKG
jgi:hypothetical protein